MRLPRVAACGGALWLASACVGPIGGWDDAGLLRDEPAIASLSGQRIGDLTPYPALLGDQLVLVACRFDSSQPVRVSGAGPGWPSDWARAAVDALDGGLGEVELVMADVRPQRSVPLISVRSIESPDAEGPSGLGDTLVECDVQEEGQAIRGTIAHAEIRIRRSLRRITGLSGAATRPEWTAAFLHELGHALGFAGHAATGESVVHLEQSVLRRLGQRAIDGEAIPVPNLTALYRIDPGRILGSAQLAPKAEITLATVRSLIALQSEKLGPAVGPFASAGDRSARLVWRWSGGLAFSVSFPDWRAEIRNGVPVTAVAGPQARRSIEREPQR